jgi:hypothetical protein
VPARRRDAAFWPCIPIYNEDGRLSSIILTAFEVFSKTYPRVSSGYSVEALVKKLAPATLKKRFDHDPEAGMYAAYGDDPAALHAVAKLLRRASGMKPPSLVAAKPALSQVDAAKALANAFVASSDAKAQAAFVKAWPRPKNSVLDRRLRELRSTKVAARLESARFMLRQACRIIGRLDDPFCHPETLDVFIAAHASERDPKVHDEIASLIGMWVHRALPDLRAADLLARLVVSGRKNVRRAALLGLGSLSQIPWEMFVPLLATGDTELRVALLQLAAERRPIEPWILEGLVVTRAPFPAKHRAVLATCAKDKRASVRAVAKAALAAI